MQRTTSLAVGQRFGAAAGLLPGALQPEKPYYDQNLCAN
jgi:hypothetical protein